MILSKQKDKEDFYKFFKPKYDPPKTPMMNIRKKMAQKPLKLMAFISFKPTYSMISTVRHY